MKRSKSYVLRSLGDEWFLIPRGEKAEEIKGVLNLSETAAFIYNHNRRNRRCRSTGRSA